MSFVLVDGKRIYYMVCFAQMLSLRNSGQV